MAKSENVKKLNPAAGLFGSKPIENNAQIVQYVHEAQQVQDVQQVQYEQEDHKRPMTLDNTQGRKGHKLPRINMAFTPENHEFIKRTSRRQGISATEYVNNLIDEARNKNL